MSIDFSQDYEAPIVTAGVTPMDEGEISLRPKTLADYTGQEEAKENLAVYIEGHALKIGSDLYSMDIFLRHLFEPYAFPYA